MLRTGLVLAGAYAVKVRKVMFAQLFKKVNSKEIARAVAEINKVLYEILVNKVKVNKGDVVRIEIDYKIENGLIKYDYDTLKIEVFKKVNEKEIEEHVKEAIKNIKQILEKGINYEVRKIGEKFGDEIYEVLYSNARAGLLLVTSVNDYLIVRGALQYPEGKIIEKVMIPKGESVELTLKERINEIINAGKDARSEDELREALKDIEELVS